MEGGQLNDEEQRKQSESQTTASEAEFDGCGTHLFVLIKMTVLRHAGSQSSVVKSSVFHVSGMKCSH